MFNFADGPRDRNALPHLPLRRVPCRGTWHAVVTTTEVLEMWTHFMGRRTLPCLKENCPGCASKIGRRYEGYVALYTNKPAPDHWIGALTDKAAAELFEQVDDRKDLRGTIITVTRLGNRANGMLTCKVAGKIDATTRLPAIPELLSHMMRIWGIQASHFGNDHPYYADGLDRGDFTGNDHGS